MLKRFNFLNGILTADITQFSTSIAVNVAELPTLGVGDFFYVTLDQDGIDGAPEIIKVTATDPGNQLLSTVVRGQFSTTARAHVADTKWCNAVYAEEIDDIVTNSVVTTDLETPIRTGGVGFRPSLSGWLDKFNNATASQPVDVVVISDSLWDIGTTTSSPSPSQLLHRALNALSGVFGADGPTPTIPSPVHAQTNASSPTATSTQGTRNSTNSLGWQGSTLTDGQVLYHTPSQNTTGWTLAYRKDPSYGTMTIRDGAGGTVLDTVDCSGTAKSGNIWTYSGLSDASHTLHITSSGTTCPEIIVPMRSSKIRVWPCGLAGAKSSDFTATPAAALDLVENLETNGTLGLVLIATGTNDNPYSTDLPALVTAVKAKVPDTTKIALWFPYMNLAINQTEYNAAHPVAFEQGITVIDCSIVGDRIYPLNTTDLTHPSETGKTMMTVHTAAVLSGDPIGVAIRAAVDAFNSRSSTALGIYDSNLSWNGTFYAALVNGTTLTLTTPAGIIAGVPDGTIAVAKSSFAEISDPSAPSANGALLYARDNGAGKTQLCVRFATGAVQVIATEP